MGIPLGIIFGLFAYFVVRCVLGGLFTVQQNERAVITTFGRADRLGNRTTLDSPIAAQLRDTERSRYAYPALRVIGPGGPYFKLPWQKVHKVDVAIRTVAIAFDPESPDANHRHTSLDAVTKDQLNIGMSGQLRYKVSEDNLYAFLFGVKNPIAHVMGYFVSILRERIANFDSQSPMGEGIIAGGSGFQGVSINDLRKNLNHLNGQMDEESRSSAARYGIVLDASLITNIAPPADIDSALAAITTAHNEVSADLSIAQALADQKIEQSKRAVEIETMRAQAEVEPLLRLAEQLEALKNRGGGAVEAYLRNVRLGLLNRAARVIRGA